MEHVSGNADKLQAEAGYICHLGNNLKVYS